MEIYAQMIPYKLRNGVGDISDSRCIAIRTWMILNLIHKCPDFNYLNLLNKVIETALKCGTKKRSTRHLRDTIESAPGADTPSMPHRGIKIE